MATRAEYDASICRRLAEAEHIPFREVLIEGVRPAVAKCHCNVDAWVSINPGSDAVRGWVTLGGDASTVILTAHSAVRGTDGKLFDITPLESEHARPSMRFIAHDGTDGAFFALKKQAPCINCLTGDTARR